MSLPCITGAIADGREVMHVACQSDKKPLKPALRLFFAPGVCNLVQVVLCFAEHQGEDLGGIVAKVQDRNV